LGERVFGHFARHALHGFRRLQYAARIIEAHQIFREVGIDRLKDPFAKPLDLIRRQNNALFTRQLNQRCKPHGSVEVRMQVAFRNSPYQFA